MYFHKNCIRSRNSDMKNVKMRGPMYDFKINICNRFKTLLLMVYEKVNDYKNNEIVGGYD